MRRTSPRSDPAKLDQGKKFLLLWGSIIAALLVIGSIMMYFASAAEQKEMIRQIGLQQGRQDFTENARRRLAERRQNDFQADTLGMGER